MSEQLTALFEQLRGSQPPAPFASPQQIRRRGRQRNHRQALAAGSAVLAVAGAGTGWVVGVAGQPSPTPPVPPGPSASSEWQSPSAAPSTPSTPSSPPTSAPATVDPPSVSAARLLTPEEFTAVSVTPTELESQAKEWPWLTVVSGCPKYRASDYPSVKERHDGRGLLYRAAGEWYAWEIVESYPDAAANMADIRKAIATCAKFQYPFGEEIEQTVVAERFAGDDSLLVRVRRGAKSDYLVVVRAGPLVATLMYQDGPEADAHAMAAAMEARLR